MPGTLALALVSPTATVFPSSLSTSFTEIVGPYPMLIDQYHDGSSDRSLIDDGVNDPRPIRVWTLTKRLTTTQLSTLRSFWETTTQAGLKPFYAYPWPAVNDPTGVATTGRVTCFFRGSWSETVGLGRTDVGQLQLVEVL
jgi:hypothetical protein